MLSELKDCIQNIDNGDNVLKNLNENIEKLEKLKFISAYHTLKAKIIELKENEHNKDFGLVASIYANEFSDYYTLIKAYAIDNEGTHWSSTPDDMKNELLEHLESIFKELAFNLNFYTDSAFGKIKEKEFCINFNEPTPDLDSYFLNDKNKTLYQTVMLDLTLKSDQTPTQKKVKL